MAAIQETEKLPVVVTLTCVYCDAVRYVYAEEVNEVPVCEKCFHPTLVTACRCDV